MEHLLAQMRFQSRSAEKYSGPENVALPDPPPPHSTLTLPPCNACADLALFAAPRRTSAASHTWRWAGDATFGVHRKCVAAAGRRKDHGDGFLFSPPLPPRLRRWPWPSLARARAPGQTGWQIH